MTDELAEIRVSVAANRAELKSMDAVASARLAVIRVELALACLAAAEGCCRHKHVVPVDLVTGETVAWLCLGPDCYEQLPAAWGLTRV